MGDTTAGSPALVSLISLSIENTHAGIQFELGDAFSFLTMSTGRL